MDRKIIDGREIDILRMGFIFCKVIRIGRKKFTRCNKFGVLLVEYSLTSLPMTKKLILPLLLGLLLFTGFKPVISTPRVEYVYLCEGPYSKVYHHSEDCRGLSNCSTKTYKVSQDEAIRMGRRPCKFEYR